MKNDWSMPSFTRSNSTSRSSIGSSYFADQNRGGYNSSPYYGTSSDAYDVRYADDTHQTYGKQYSSEDNE